MSSNVTSWNMADLPGTNLHLVRFHSHVWWHRRTTAEKPKMEIMKESWIDSQPFPSWFSSIWAKRICKNAELHSSWYGARSSLRRCLKPFGVAGRWGFWVAISPRYEGFLTTTHVRNKSLKCGRSRDTGVPKNLPAIIFKASSQSQPPRGLRWPAQS